ncbi:MAG TPA: HEAT repeat domain-containing protein [Bryobacteraceae bacterium]|jgi:HEAT repeat protein|nr:HEAT repeat domain-containing protein [Bryobacteraceae bacterium]
MKRIGLFLFCAGALAAADDRVGRMLDEKLTVAQRNNACFALRGSRSPEVVAALRGAMSSGVVRACAARNLREAGAVDELAGALSAPEPEVRAVAARELGAFERPELIDVLVKAAHDPNLLVATNAVMGLGQYHDRAVLLKLLDLAAGGGAVGVTALSRAAQFDEPAALPVARKLLSGIDPAGKLIALVIVADCGDSGDLPRLRELAAKSETVGTRGRGFGLMPALDVSRAAKNAIESIQKRHAA